MTSGAAAATARLGVCVPLAVEKYGNWGREAHTTFTRLATRLAISLSLPKSRVTADLMADLVWC